ncbi:hypothetical protein ACOMHN_034745 [Nucella lapillus]
MWTMVKSLVIGLAFTFFYCPDVPLVEAAALSKPDFGVDNTAGVQAADLSLTKRGKGGVDAWSICPPDMADVDCFYAYLRVYARLRKAAEESDRVSMRNIGKRSSSAMTSTPELPRRTRRVKWGNVCPEGLVPAQCYQALRTLYRRMQTSLLNAE